VGLIELVCIRYSGADSGRVQQVHGADNVSILGQCTAGRVGLIVSVYSRHSGAECVSVQQIQWD